MKRVKPGIYKHLKGNLYEVIEAAHHTETLEEFVVYRALYDSAEFGKNALWVRPAKMFLETVQKDGRTIPRFQFIEELKPNVRVGVGVFVLHLGKVLMGHRTGSHGKDTWAPPGGHLEFGETVESCARRETKEETGLTIKNLKKIGYSEDLFKTENKHYITIWIEAATTSPDAKILEPEKCDEWKWFELSKLPKNLFLPTKQIVKQHYKI